MALVLADRVRDTTTTTGTGTVTLSGTAPTGYQNFSVVGDGNTTYYTINAGSEWETGIGTYSSTGPTLARTTVLASSNSGSLVNFSAGTKDVFVTYPAEKSVNYDASNNVGIGDTAPAYKLTVAGDMRLTGGGDVRLSSATGTTTAGGDSMIYNDANNMIFTTGTTTAERMRIDASGNVGIGTSSPLSKATVSQSGTVKLSLESQGSWNAGVGADASGNLLFYNPLATERMRVDSSGNVGIGTTAPGQKLEVVGGIAATSGSNQVLLGTDGAIEIARSGGGAYIDLKDSVAEDFDCRIQSLGTTTPSLSFSVNGGERMRIDSSGNLGLGTSSPSTRFNVKGGTTWLQNFNGSASSPTEAVDWPVPALNVTSFGDFTLQTMMTFTLPNDGNYFTGDSVWNFRLDQTASSTTSSGVNGMRFMGPGYLMFGPGTTEKARIDSSGNLLVGTTAPLAANTSNEYKTTTAGLWPLTLNANDRGLLMRQSNGSSGFYAYFEYNGGTNNGSISWSGGTTFYNVTSDARIKDNIVDAPEAGDLIDDIRVRSWDFKADGAHWRYGMVAQELIEVVPEAVFAPEDPELMMGVDYAKLVPLLIKEVQSLRARVAQLEGK